MGFRGPGGEPPVGGGGSKFPKAAHVFIEKVKGAKGAEPKKVGIFTAGVGQKDIPVVVLDRVVDYATRIHPRFKHKGVFGNYAVCISKTDARGCPIDSPLNEDDGRWFLCMTVVDRSKWTQTMGKQKGRVYTDSRKLVLIPYGQVEDMQSIGTKVGGWRGAKFDVSRSKDQKSSRIGTTWFPAGTMTEEQMKATFEKPAADYGLPVEKFLEPFDYDQVLKAKSFEELKVIAQEISSDTSAVADDSEEPETEAKAETAIEY